MKEAVDGRGKHIPFSISVCILFSSSFTVPFLLPGTDPEWERTTLTPCPSPLLIPHFESQQIDNRLQLASFKVVSQKLSKY